MKKRIGFFTCIVSLITATCLLFLPTVRFAQAASAAKKTRRTLAIGGELVGIRLKTAGVLVVGTEPFLSQGISVDPASAAGLKKGDVLIEMRNQKVSDAQTATQIIAEGGVIEMVFERNGIRQSAELRPQISDATGLYKGGLWIRDSAAGIGTLTYSDTTNRVSVALGHGIYDADTGGLMPVENGELTDATFSYVTAGRIGSPGEIGGTIGSNQLGEIYENRDDGVFATLSLMQGEPDFYETAFQEEIHTGEAQIVCTVSDGDKQFYEVEITRICDRKSDTKNMVVHVTDPTLLSLTGGIVQGMSGAPILQDGRLIGAVTHVFVNDPSSGYGIFIENMMD